MRIATSMLFDAGVSSINKQWASLLHIQQQIAAGRRILKPSDDPVAASRALEVTQSADINAQFGTNHDNAKSLLGLEEAQLGSLVDDLLPRLKELVVQAGAPALTASQRQSLAVELRGRFQELLNIANSADGQGQFMFSGYKGATKPFGGTVDFLIAGNEISYAGDDGQRRLQVSAPQMLEVSDAGSDVFMRIASGNGYFSTGYTAGNTGTGSIDNGTVTDPTAWNGLADKNLSIVFTTATTYDIVDSSSAVIGSGIYQSGQPIAIPGGGATVTISGAPAATDSFTIQPSASQSIFKTLANLIGVLEGTVVTPADQAKYASDLSAARVNLDQAASNIIAVRAQVGSRLSALDSLSSLNQDLKLQYSQTLSNLQDLDYAKATADLTRKQTDLQAAQQSFARISQLSLFDYL